MNNMIYGGAVTAVTDEGDEGDEEKGIERMTHQPSMLRPGRKSRAHPGAEAQNGIPWRTCTMPRLGRPRALTPLPALKKVEARLEDS
jgi:hypothetical protein